LYWLGSGGGLEQRLLVRDFHPNTIVLQAFLCGR
jgi:hypothetical protein